MRIVSRSWNAPPGSRVAGSVWRARRWPWQRQALRGHRNPDEQGAMLVLATFAIIMLLMVAGVVIDLGNAYAGGRQMQDAADASAIAATEELECYLFAPTGPTPPGVGCQIPGTATTPVAPKDIAAVASLVAHENGASSTTPVSCQIIGPYDPALASPGYSTITACANWNGDRTSVPTPAGVHVEVGTSQTTFFGGVTGTKETSEYREAAATIQPIVGESSPILFCALVGGADSGLANLLLPAGSVTTALTYVPVGSGWLSSKTPPGWQKAITGVLSPGQATALPSKPWGYVVNPAAVGVNYLLYAPNGGHSGKGVSTCGLGSSNFKGQTGGGSFTLPGQVPYNNGESAGPVANEIANEPGCGTLFSNGSGGSGAPTCDLLVPLCVGEYTTSRDLYCVTFGAFNITSVGAATRTYGTFLGLVNATVGTGGLGSPTGGVPNAVRLVQ